MNGEVGTPVRHRSTNADNLTSRVGRVGYSEERSDTHTPVVFRTGEEMIADGELQVLPGNYWTFPRLNMDNIHTTVFGQTAHLESLYRRLDQEGFRGDVDNNTDLGPMLSIHCSGEEAQNHVRRIFHEWLLQNNYLPRQV